MRPLANAEVEVVEHGGEATSLIETWDGVPRIIVVDAVQSCAEPGTVVRVDVHRDGLNREPAWFSSHSLGLADAVFLARRLDRLPPSLIVVGIVGQRFGVGEGLSVPVERAVANVARRLTLELGLRGDSPLQHEY